MLAGMVAKKDYSPRATEIESTAKRRPRNRSVRLFFCLRFSTGIIQAILAHPCRTIPC